jgi:hypothetical protein
LFSGLSLGIDCYAHLQGLVVPGRREKIGTDLFFLKKINLSLFSLGRIIDIDKFMIDS